MSRSPTKPSMIDSTEIDIDKSTVSMSVADTAKGSNPLLDSVIVTEPVYATAQLDEEAFMAQPIDVMLLEPSNENEPQFAEVTVNGNYRLLPRDGNVITIPRAHVGVLCDAKVQRVTQRKVVTPDGSMGYEEQIKTALAYPFSVVSDPSGPKGAEWLKRKLRSAAA